MLRVPPDVHTQNGRVERVHLTILNDVRTVLLLSGLPTKYWAEAANYSAYTRNHTLSNNKQTPLDLRTGNKTTIDQLYSFGCKLFFRDHRQTSKLQPLRTYTRVIDGSHTYRVLDYTNKRVITTQDVVFASEPGFASATMQDVKFELCKTQKLRFASVPDTTEVTENVQEQPPVATPPAEEEIQAQNDIP
jgi:hypothetical protein